jgi:pimeloyl-ACP methyl ester carboxylesterase
LFWLHQTTTALQETTVTLQWTEFHSVNKDTTAETPVLLLHGLLGSKRNFASLASSLGNQLEKQRRIIGVDLRNHGDSDHAPEMTYTAMAKDVLEFMNSQGLEKAVLIGHSMGGKIAQAMSLLYPERVDGLVVLDIAPVEYSSNDPHWKAVEDIMHAMRSVEDASTKAVLDKQLRTSIPDPNLRAFVLTNYDARSKGWKIPVSTICNQLDCIAGFDVTKVTSNCYEGDVFIIHGGQSRFVRHAYMDRIAELFPNHMLTTIRGAGHWVHAEAPDDTIALLKRYLDR